jgi:hypothetical protein
MPPQASLSEEQAHSQQSPSSNAVSRPQPQLSQPSQRRQPTSITSRPLPPQPTGIPSPHRQLRLKLRITQAVYLQSMSIKAHTIHNRVLIVGILSPQYKPSPIMLTGVTNHEELTSLLSHEISNENYLTKCLQTSNTDP